MAAAGKLEMIGQQKFKIGEWEGIKGQGKGRGWEREKGRR